MALIHIIEGEAGCRAAVERGAVAVVVDALRTSATIAALFDAGAREVVATATLDHARALKEARPEALLAGAMGGARIPGFDLANSPSGLRRDPRTGRRPIPKGCDVIIASTVGTARLVQCAAAPAVVVASPVNARPAARYVTRLAAAEPARDVVVVPAGPSDPASPTPEDLWGACYVASLMGPDIAEECRELYERTIDEVIGKGLRALFAGCPNARRLEKVGAAADIATCAEPNTCRSVPIGAGPVEIPGVPGAVGLRLAAASLDDDFPF